jgi:hypothetical protein
MHKVSQQCFYAYTDSNNNSGCVSGIGNKGGYDNMGVQMNAQKAGGAKPPTGIENNNNNNNNAKPGGRPDAQPPEGFGEINQAAKGAKA